MDIIINASKPELQVKYLKQAEINCPNCDSKMKFDGRVVDIGNIVKCNDCGKKHIIPLKNLGIEGGKLYSDG